MRFYEKSRISSSEGSRQDRSTVPLEHTLITNLLDEKLYPAMELIPLYHERWETELVFDAQKTHQEPRRASKPAHLRSETPAGVIQELYALSLGHFVVRSLMFEAAQGVA